MRTRFGKITAANAKFGKAATALNESDKEIYKTLAFLESHVKRVPSRQSFKFNCDFNEADKINDGSLRPSSTDSKSADKRSDKSDDSIKMESNHNLIEDLLSRADRVEEFRKSLRKMQQNRLTKKR